MKEETTPAAKIFHVVLKKGGAQLPNEVGMHRQKEKVITEKVIRL